MCNDVDLFGEVVVTYDDVELWLRTVPRYSDDIRPNQVADYVRNYDVVNKIKAEKLAESFECLNERNMFDKFDLSQSVRKAFKPRLSHISQRPPSMR